MTRDGFALLVKADYHKTSITQAKNIFLLYERGYSKLIKISSLVNVMSRDVSESFDKKHKWFIADFEEGAQNWTALFIESAYVYPQIKWLYKEYLLTEEGFYLLVVGFTEKKAG